MSLIVKLQTLKSEQLVFSWFLTLHYLPFLPHPAAELWESGISAEELEWCVLAMGKDWKAMNLERAWTSVIPSVTSSGIFHSEEPGVAVEALVIVQQNYKFTKLEALWAFGMVSLGQTWLHNLILMWSAELQPKNGLMK